MVFLIPGRTSPGSVSTSTLSGARKIREAPMDRSRPKYIAGREVGANSFF